MTNIISQNPIIKKIVAGEAGAEMLEFLVSKQLPLIEEEYLEGLVFVLKIDNESLKSRAMSRLSQISESTKLNYIEKSHANHRVAYFIMLEALNLKNLKIIVKVVRNQALPYDFLIKIAEKGDLAMLEVLLDNQIKLIAYPEIMEVMEKNPEANNFIKGRIKEIRDFYLSREAAEEIPLEEVQEVLEEIKEVIAKEQEKTKDPGQEQKAGIIIEEEDEENPLDLARVEQKTMTTLQEINNMNISERIKLALIGSKTHRMILIKDPNKMVVQSVVESPKLTADEVILMARDKSIAGDVIGKISANREWVKNYSVMLELVHNPKTPIRDALGFVKKLHMRDLKLLTHDKNINPVVRQLAYNYHNEKSRVQKK
jgi:hypothetical protein